MWCCGPASHHGAGNRLLFRWDRPLNITWAASRLPTILAAWHPGMEGGNALADLLFGDANPSGKLPVCWPRNAGQIPVYYAHNLTHQPETAEGFTSRYWDEPSAPLYPFGYGLSFTEFGVSNLQVKQAAVKPGAPAVLTVDVQNKGKRAGEEVVQVYIHQRAGSASRPVRELKGFEKVALAPGERKTLHFSIGGNERSYWSSSVRGWVEEAEAFDVWVGTDARAALHSSFTVSR
jgi:beta-glucosidase